MHYEDGTEVQTLTLKMVLPSKWAGHTVDYLKDFFVEHYNTKKPENVLDATEMHLEKKGNAILFGDELLHTAVQKYDDLFLKPGKSMPKPVRAQ
ncbi:chp-1 rar1 homologue, partial [Plasmopara halstedii]